MVFVVAVRYTTVVVVVVDVFVICFIWTVVVDVFVICFILDC